MGLGGLGYGVFVCLWKKNNFKLNFFPGIHFSSSVVYNVTLSPSSGHRLLYRLKKKMDSPLPKCSCFMNIFCLDSNVFLELTITETISAIVSLFLFLSFLYIHLIFLSCIHVIFFQFSSPFIFLSIRDCGESDYFPKAR